jgi:hypothetical protein
MREINFHKLGTEYIITINRVLANGYENLLTALIWNSKTEYLGADS